MNSQRSPRLAGALLAALFAAVSVCVAGPSAATPVRSPACVGPAGQTCSIRLSTGITMRYRQVGPDDGTVVFLLHGYTDTSRSWSLLVPALHRLLPQLRIVVPDLRGHGSTSLPDGANCPAQPDQCFRPIDFADDIVAFMNAENITRAAIVGHSMGSLVAQELALDHPNRVSSLVLVSTGTDGQQPAVEFLHDDVVDGLWQQAFIQAGYDWPTGIYDVPPGVAAPDFTDFIDNQWVVSNVAPQELLDRIRLETAQTPLGTWIGTLDDLVTADNTERLEGLTVPTLVIWGSQDDVFSYAAEQKLIASLEVAASVGGSFWWKQYGQLPPSDSGEQTDLGHNLPWEAPDGLARDLASFLATGRPTCTLYHTDYPTDVHHVVAVPDHAIVVHGGASTRGHDCRR